MNLMDLFRPYPVLKKGIVNLKSGTSLRAVVFQQVGEYLVLRSVEMLQDRGVAVKGAPPKMDGEVLVLRSDVDFIQVVS